MPKERVRREKQPRGPLQCQYPGRCSNERAIKPNGGRHWLCESHRDHQNALQRDRYKKITKSTKKKSPLTKKKSARKLQPPTTKPVEVEEGDAAIARGDDAELGSPLNVEADRMAVAATKTSQARVSCSTDDTSDHRAQEPTSTSSVDSVQASDASKLCQGPVCTCAATAPTQLPQVVYVFLHGTPIVFGGPAQPQQAIQHACGCAAAERTITPSLISFKASPGKATQCQPFSSQAIDEVMRATSACNAVGVPLGVSEDRCTGNTRPRNEGASTREDGSSDKRQPSFHSVQEL
ncbi:hypothetical protein PF003_g38774 [Phytophthora fragariae]|nr:hypothetical protein PF003_g38774 [Phytophthora fragariae]